MREVNHNPDDRRVLVIDDEMPIRTALSVSFRREGWQVETAANCAEARSLFRMRAVPLVVSDIRLPDGDGVSLMREFRLLSPDTGVVLLTAHGSVPQAVEAVRDGACDYLLKPAPFRQIKEALERVNQKIGPRSNNQKLEPIPQLLGSSSDLLAAIQFAKQAAASDADILIEAESGTGKELLARRIHGESSRRFHPFIAVNCAAVPETLIESELFGHVKGAFTGAISARAGRFEVAEHGTLLLDEIGELPLALQPKLLRVLQERQHDRLGDNRPVPVDVRVIATTNRSLSDLVQEGKFRLDLYYRLNVIPLTIPPLRQRGDDVVLLAEHFLSLYARGRHLRMAPEFIEALRCHSWPGNVRELSNVMRRAVVLCTSDEIGPEFLSFMAGHQQYAGTVNPGLSMREAERRLLELTLAATSGNRTRAAEMLGVSLRTVRNKIRDYGLPPRRLA